MKKKNLNRQKTSVFHPGMLQCLALFLVVLLPILPVQAAGSRVPLMQEEQPEGYWELTGSDASDSWLGNNYHGLESAYTPLYGEGSLSANYVQYNPRFTATARQTVASSLDGVCSWDWAGGSIPQKIIPGNSYPFSMTATASYAGSNLLGATVKAFTQITPNSSIAYAEAYLNIDGSNTFDSQTVSASLSLPAGQSEDESRPVTLLCQVDIVTIKQVHHYHWKETSCSATVSLPAGMQPDKEFTPQVSVVDMENLPVKPDKETWFYNDSASSLPMKWDGNEAEVKYEYVCPGGTQARTTTVTIPKAASCTATLTLPEKMVPDEFFTPDVSVVDSEDLPVTPASETWYYNSNVSQKTMKWDGRQAVVRYDYICPDETEINTISLTIPPVKTCDAVIILPEKMEADREFTPRAEVVDKGEGTPLVPQVEKWYLNGELSSLPMKWDGKTASVKYEYLCPLDNQTLTAEKSIPPAEGGNFILVVGGLAAVAAAGLAAAGAGAVAIKSGSKTGLAEQYILQVDKPYLEVNLKDTVPLFIQVWKIKSDGSVVPASDAAIRLELPDERSGLMAAPVSGTGSMTCSFTVPYPKACTDVPVNITASAGLLNKSTQVTVRIVPLYELSLSYHDPASTRLQPGGKEIYAIASLKATPMPDARTTADDLARRIDLTVDGPNSNLLRTSTTTGQQPYASGGQLWIPLSMPLLPTGESLQPGKPTLIASFTDGSKLLQSHLQLDITGECRLGAWVMGKKQADVLFDKQLENPHWRVSEIVAYFHDPDDENTPVHPGYDYTLDAECVKFDPDVLVVSNIIQQNRDEYTIKCEMKGDVFLEDFFGENLELHKGIIKATISPKCDESKNLYAEVQYQLRPQFELFANREGKKEREYKGLTLLNLEVVVDGDDRLPISIGARRTDKGIDRSTEAVNELNPDLWIYEFSLKGSQAENFTVEEDEDTPLDQAPRLLIQSKGPELFSKDRWADDLVLHLEGSMEPFYGGHYLEELVDCDLDIKLLYPNLKLWVVPGKERGTSEAWMVTYLGSDPERRLADTILNVETKSFGSGQLLTPNGDQQASVITGPDGTEQVNLWYRDLDWSNYRQGLFTVSAVLTNRAGDRESQPVEVAVNIGKNVSRLLEELYLKSDMLKLNNPYYMDETMGLSDLIALTSYRPMVRGPVWNASLTLSELAASQDKTTSFHFYRDYVCSELRDRISEWLITRRHYRPGGLHTIETVQSMNGIEFDHFTIGGVHNYEALFLSGMQPEEDPRGLDPWWKQNWLDQAYLDPDGLITNNWQRLYSTETAAWLQISLTPLAVLAIWSGGVTVAAAMQLLGPVISAYAAATAGQLGSKWEMGTVFSGGKYGYNRRDNLYTPRNVFTDEWAAGQGK